MQSSGVRRKLSMIAKGGGAPLCSSKKVLGGGWRWRVIAEDWEASCAGWCRPEGEGDREQGDGWGRERLWQNSRVIATGGSGQIPGLC